MLEERSIDDVVDTLRRAKQEGVGRSLLIGSGCSVTARIPTADGFVRIIENEYPLQYDREDLIDGLGNSSGAYSLKTKWLLSPAFAGSEFFSFLVRGWRAARLPPATFCHGYAVKAYG